MNHKLTFTREFPPDAEGGVRDVLSAQSQDPEPRMRVRDLARMRVRAPVLLV